MTAWVNDLATDETRILDDKTLELYFRSSEANEHVQNYSVIRVPSVFYPWLNGTSLAEADPCSVCVCTWPIGKALWVNAR